MIPQEQTVKTNGCCLKSQFWNVTTENTIGWTLPVDLWKSHKRTQSENITTSRLKWLMVYSIPLLQLCIVTTSPLGNLITGGQSVICLLILGYMCHTCTFSQISIISVCKNPNQIPPKMSQMWHTASPWASCVQSRLTWLRTSWRWEKRGTKRSVCSHAPQCVTGTLWIRHTHHYIH